MNQNINPLLKYVKIQGDSFLRALYNSLKSIKRRKSQGNQRFRIAEWDTLSFNSLLNMMRGNMTLIIAVLPTCV